MIKLMSVSFLFYLFCSNALNLPNKSKRQFAINIIKGKNWHQKYWTYNYLILLHNIWSVGLGGNGEDSFERSIQLVMRFSYQNQNNLVNCSTVFQKKTKSDQEESLVKFVQRVSFVRKLFPRRNIRRSCVLTRNAHIWPNRQPQYHTLG